MPSSHQDGHTPVVIPIRTVLVAAVILLLLIGTTVFASAYATEHISGPDESYSNATSQDAYQDVIVAPEVDVDIETVVEREEIPFEVVERDDPNSMRGNKSVVTEGQEGVTLVTRVVTIENGAEVVVPGSEIHVIASLPVDEVVAVGTAVAPAIPATSNAGENRATGKSMAADRGWTGDEWDCLNALWTKESNWRHTAANPNSSAYGIPQSLPGSKMKSAGSDWETNPATQIKWGLGYISNRYGTPCKAWAHSVERNWY